MRSAIVNIGTNAAEPQNPRYKFALYGATKSYNHILSSGLEEWYGDKIDIMTVMPRQTKTKMNPANYLFTGLWSCEPYFSILPIYCILFVFILVTYH